MPTIRAMLLVVVLRPRSQTSATDAGIARFSALPPAQQLRRADDDQQEYAGGEAAN